MRDLNFFSIYQGSKKEQKDEKTYLYIVAGLLLGIILVTFTINIVRIVMLNNDIKSYTDKLSVSDVQANLREAEEINGKIEILAKYEGALSKVADSINKNDVVTDDLLNDICNAMPGDVSFKDFNIEGYDVKISGVTHTRTAIGEFEHNLGGISKIKKVHVNKIDKSNAVGEDYSFEMTCILKEVE